MSDFKAKMHQIRFWLGLCPDPAGGAYSAPPDPLTGFKGPTSIGGEGEERRGRETMERGEERKGKGGDPGCAPPPNFEILATPLYTSKVLFCSL